MADVVDFRRPPSDSELQWRCNCGCETFYARCDNVLVCANCSVVADELVGNWTEVLGPVKVLAEKHKEGLVVRTMGSSTAAARRSMQSIDPDTVVAIIGIKPDGAVTTFCRSETPEQFDWTDRHITLARDLIMKDRPE